MDRYLIRAGIGIIFFIFLCYLVLFVTTTPEEHKALEAPPVQWVNVNEPGQGFSGHFPIEPTRLTESLPLEKGKGLATYYLYISTLPDDTTYMVKVIDFPETFSLEKPLDILTKSIDDMLAKDPQNVLEGKKEISFAGEKAIEFSFSNTLSKLIAITFIKKDKQYMIVYLARPERFDETSFRSFVADFRF